LRFVGICGSACPYGRTRQPARADRSRLSCRSAEERGARLAGAAPPRQQFLAKEALMEALMKSNKAKQPLGADRSLCLCHDEGRTRRSGLIDCCPVTTHA
jgi:hypothetical protein